MSDLISEFWGYYIAAVALVGTVWCIWLLFSQRRTQVAPGHSADEDTGHIQDGDLRELNNPLPRWWMWMFLLSCIFTLGYLILYPGLGAYDGVPGFSTRGELASQRAVADAQVRPLYERHAGMDIKQTAVDPQVHEIGQHLFLNSCAQCHGSDAGGSKGSPNLTDNDWLYGGEPETTLASITKGRHGVMPLLAAVVDSNQTVNVANYVCPLSGLAHDPVKATRDEPTSKSVCAACHMAIGKGNQAFGAPNLTDRVWLYGSSEAIIVETILKGRDNTMPAHENLLSSEKTRMLATCVWGLSDNNTSHAQ